MHLIYDGPSLLDGKQIIVLASGFKNPSSNKKTGAMIQTYILRKNITPSEAHKTGEDISICGNCKLRNGICYVLVFQAPSAIYRAYKNNNLTLNTSLENLGKDKPIRIGSYGDPAAVPIHIWERFTKYADFHTGYTHQWKTCDQNLKNFVWLQLIT